MEKEIEASEVTTQKANDVDYLEAIKTLKETSVSKSDYDAIREENKRLINSIVNGSAEFKEEEESVTPNIEELKKTLNSDCSNLEYVKAALDLRNARIKEGQPDPFLPYGNNVLPTQQDIECAERVANVFQECIDYAQGDSDVFTTELMRRTIDVKR